MKTALLTILLGLSVTASADFDIRCYSKDGFETEDDCFQPASDHFSQAGCIASENADTAEEVCEVRDASIVCHLSFDNCIRNRSENRRDRHRPEPGCRNGKRVKMAAGHPDLEGLPEYICVL